MTFELFQPLAFGAGDAVAVIVGFTVSTALVKISIVSEVPGFPRSVAATVFGPGFSDTVRSSTGGTSSKSTALNSVAPFTTMTASVTP